MGEGTSPYRAVQQATGPRYAVRPLLLKRLLVMLLAVALVPAALYATLWSREVTLFCTLGADRTLRCEVREGQILGGDVQQREIRGAFGASLAGVTEGTRGDAWIDVATETGPVPLTRGLNVAKGAQRRAAEDLSAYIRDPRRPSTLTRSFGSRFAYLFVPLGGLLVAVFGLVVLGQRAVITVDRAHRLLVVEARRFPLRATRVAVELDRLDGVRATLDSAGRPRVEAVLRSGETVPLFLAQALLVTRIVAGVSALIRDAREE